MRSEKEKEANPLNDKDFGKALIPKTLNYQHKMGDTMTLRIRRPRRQEYDDDKGSAQATKIASFLGQTRCCADEQETAQGTPGITWI